MNRRTFLQAVALATSAALVPVVAEAAAPKKLPLTPTQLARQTSLTAYARMCKALETSP